ncbi:hypothetical protein CspeluHIS016_0113360 [Cutaneotrichosporon spelunceum]|uniref:Uncharacterized protein n=1 Tax=Cutaneotrichosporon spelunceum TaxID=1672016 RepID=A0AAD3TQ32_9TREE|nr:hypothetical protein CspeluHIS016_0113360 [Cutaneotrichosporon spelunceum]
MGWLRRVRGKGPKAPASEPALPTHSRRESLDIVDIHHADADGYSTDDVLQPPLGDPGAGMASLQLSPSETNLYLQALAGLDKVNPNLPLYIDSAPTLPNLPIDAEPMPTPDIPYPTTPDIIPALHPNRQNRQHGLLVLSGDATVQITGFPAVVVPELDTALKTWEFGIATRSDQLDQVAKCHPEMPIYWKAELRGKVWRLKGTQELESIRLLLAIFSALAHHGYTMLGAVQPAVSRPESHSLLFTYTANVEQVPPLFFAVTLPQPDRISLVNPPMRIASQLLMSIRGAITSLHRPPPSSHPSHFRAIKLEGWVHAGVYRFWLAGLRRWPAGSGGVKKDAITKLRPLLVLGITDAAKYHKFTFVASVPLLPRTTGRDVMIFSSTPESGLCYRDAYSEETEPKGVLAPLNGQADIASPGEENPSLMDRSHPLPRRRGSDGSFSSTNFYPATRSSPFPSPTKPPLHTLQTTASYDEMAFSRPSARTSLDRERRITAERMSQSSRRPSHSSQASAYLEQDPPSLSSTKVPLDLARTAPSTNVPLDLPQTHFTKTSPSSPPMNRSASPPPRPASPTTRHNGSMYRPVGDGPGNTHMSPGSRAIRHNDFMIHPTGDGPGSNLMSLASPTNVPLDLPQTYFTKASPSSPSVNRPAPPRLRPESATIRHNDFMHHPTGDGPGSTHINSDNFVLATTAPPGAYPSADLAPRRLGAGPRMVYPPLSPGNPAATLDSHVPLLSIDTDTVSARSRYSYDSSTAGDEDDEWNPEPPKVNRSPVSDRSSAFVTPPSSPGPRSSSPNPNHVSGTPQPKASVSPSASRPPAPVSGRLPHRMQPIAAAHQGNWFREDGQSHDEAVRLINRDRAGMLSRGSVMSEGSYISTTSSRPPGVGTTRTRVSLTMPKEQRSAA